MMGSAPTAEVGVPIAERVICIPLADVFHDVHLRTYYKGEGVKRKDIDADLTQSSGDDNDELGTFATTAANKVAAIIYTKLPHTRLTIADGDIIFTFSDVIKENTRPMMQKAITDYIVNWCLYMWYHTTYPELAGVYLESMPIYEDEVIRCTNMIQRLVRKRYAWF